MAAHANASLYVGQLLAARFQIKQLIGSGEFCFVFEAKDVQTGRDVAVKILANTTLDAVLEFETEAELLRRLESRSNVVSWIMTGTDQIAVTVQQTGTTVQLPVRFIVLELASAHLTELVVQLDKVSWEDRLLLFRDSAKGVHQMHLDEIAHRDIKSENILVFSQPKASFQAKVADLGRSRDLVVNARFPASAYTKGRGDLRFAPPELLWLLGEDNRECWLRVDLFLLGSLLFELGTGQGITAMALGSGMTLIRQNLALPHARRLAAFASRLPEIKTRFEHPYGIFEAELPPRLKHEGAMLLRALTNPDPLGRGPTPGLSNRKDLGLEWVLRRLDIMLLTLRVSRKNNKARIRKRQ